MVTPTNHVIAGLDLHRAGPLVLWGFLQDILANIVWDDFGTKLSIFPGYTFKLAGKN